jgi:hypothetical protein
MVGKLMGVLLLNPLVKARFRLLLVHCNDNLGIGISINYQEYKKLK